jgi:hypothetical protein
LDLFLLKLYIFFMRCLFACWCVETPLSTLKVRPLTN